MILPRRKTSAPPWRSGLPQVDLTAALAALIQNKHIKDILETVARNKLKGLSCFDDAFCLPCLVLRSTRVSQILWPFRKNQIL